MTDVKMDLPKPPTPNGCRRPGFSWSRHVLNPWVLLIHSPVPRCLFSSLHSTTRLALRGLPRRRLVVTSGGLDEMLPSLYFQSPSVSDLFGLNAFEIGSKDGIDCFISVFKDLGILVLTFQDSESCILEDDISRELQHFSLCVCTGNRLPELWKLSAKDILESPTW